MSYRFLLLKYWHSWDRSTLIISLWMILEKKLSFCWKYISLVWVRILVCNKFWCVALICIGYNTIHPYWAQWKGIITDFRIKRLPTPNPMVLIPRKSIPSFHKTTQNSCRKFMELGQRLRDCGWFFSGKTPDKCLITLILIDFLIFRFVKSKRSFNFHTECP